MVYSRRVCEWANANTQKSSIKNIIYPEHDIVYVIRNGIGVDSVYRNGYFVGTTKSKKHSIDSTKNLVRMGHSNL